MHVCASFDESVAELFDSLASRTRFTHHLCAVFNCILQPTGKKTNDVICSFVEPVVPDNPVKFGDTRLNLSRAIPPEAVSAGIFDGFPR